MAHVLVNEVVGEDGAASMPLHIPCCDRDGNLTVMMLRVKMVERWFWWLTDTVLGGRGTVTGFKSYIDGG